MNSGIWGYGVSIPWRRITVEEIHNVWKNIPISVVKRRGVNERAVIGPDEDTITLSADAAFKALRMSGLSLKDIGALLLGSQTSPYHTRPAAAILAEAIGLKSNIFAADIQFSGKSGTSAFLLGLAYVDSGMTNAAIVIGADNLSFHVSPGDAQEYVASSGAGAVVIAKGEGIVAIESSASYTTDTPDWFRLDGERYIRTGGAAMTNTEVGMQNHVIGAWKSLNSNSGYSPNTFRYLVIQQLDGRSPFQIGQKLSFSKEQISPGIISDFLGDCGAASPLIGLAKVLDQASPDEKIAMISYGAGAGSDALVLRTTEKIEKVSRNPTVETLISKKMMVDYATYIKMERKYYTHERKVTTFE